MFKLFCPQVPLENLLKSGLFDERSFYNAFLRDLKRSEAEVIIESPYLTVKRVTAIAPILQRLRKKGVKVTVNTRFPEHHGGRLRFQAWEATGILKSSGVKVRFFKDYNHRKVAIIDNRILWEGSLNILSQSYSREVMRRIESEEITQQMVRFLGLKRFYW
jgi:phosphatidylserine/phosphatidylglycerophosphate/cardiolipin synthase-like enzyme